MADNIVTINFNNDTVTDPNGNAAKVNGSVQVDYTTNSYSGSYTVAGGGISGNGTLSNSGGLSNNNGSYTLGDGKLSLTYSGQQPTASSALSYSIPPQDFGGGFVIPGDTYSATSQPLTATTACYVTGTLIRTDRGDVRVEDLAIGDMVVTASGAHRPIKWIGHRSYAGRFANSNSEALPICFKAGSIEQRVPVRDLWVSPKHAMFIEGVLIAAEHLVNGTSIVKAKMVESLTYWHVELDSHDILIAEGAYSESYIDDNSRAMFHNALEFSSMYPDAGRPDAICCAPRIDSGYILAAVRDRLLELADGAATERSYGGLEGEFTIADGAVQGWALSVLYPNAPVCLDIIINGSLAAQTITSNSGGSNRHAFHAAVGIQPDDVVEVRRSIDGASIHGKKDLTIAA